MRARLVAAQVLFCLASASLAACGGGGGGGGAALPPVSVQPAGGTASGSSAPAAVSISIAIPGTSTSSARRRARYVSAGTKSATVSYAGSTQTTNCGATCSLTLNVMPGTVTFAISLFDQPNGAGHVLSSAQTTATIMPGANNALKLTFDAVIASVAVAVGTNAVTAGTPATIPVTVAAKDAAGYTIVGTDAYAVPIALSVDDTSGAFALSSATVTAPASTVNLVYNGRTAASAVHVGANAGGAAVSVDNATVSVQSAPVGTPPPGTAPAHVTTWYYYGLNDANDSVPAAWMAAHADYAEGDAANSVALLQAYKSAGGKNTVSYTDPAFSAYCRAPFTAPAGTCEGPMGGLVTGDESAWLHASDGSRVHRFMSAHFQYQEAMNPAAVAVRDAYRRSTAASLASAPSLDYFFADDSGGVLNGSDGTQLSGLLYNF
ncbi:MAG: hypothetical protein QOD51_1268, partial [Candidatus Eremiobacteraeota bacterium]|nr:hypothetical protein [Candidatus Eremiobacteraeota bacterium]